MRKFEQQNTQTPWTEPEDDLLRKRWAEGFSASEIAKLLEGRSRNSVIGRTHRLGLCGDRATRVRSRRGGIMAPANGTSRRILTPPVQRTKQLAAQAHPARLLPPTEPDLPILSERGVASQGTSSAGLSLLDLLPSSCRFPFGDPREENFSFCRATRVPGRPYCENCLKRAYQKPGAYVPKRPKYAEAA